MTILVDDRHPHPGDSHAAFCRRFNGLAQSTRLECGDLVFWDAAGVRTCVIEVKRPDADLVDSVTHTGRLVQQLRSARFVFPDCTYVLVIEGGKYAGPDGDGDWAIRRGGVWEKCGVPGAMPPRGVSYQRVVNFLNTLRFCEGVNVIDTASESETVRYALALYQWWQKPLDEHTSTTENRLHTPIYFDGGRVPLVRQWAAALPGVGMKRGKAVQAVFLSALDMANGTVAQWAAVEGIGPVTAERAYRAIRKGEG